MTTKSIFIVEDDAPLRNAIESFLKRLKYNVKSFDCVEFAIKDLDDNCDLIVSDVMMPKLTGYDLLKFVRKKYPAIPVILMTAYGSIEKAVEAMKDGAYDFLVKPFSLNVLEMVIKAVFLDRQSALEKERVEKLPRTTEALRSNFRNIESQFVTGHPKVKQIVENLRRIAPSKATVLIQGESGTGKELIAKMIHEFSPRSSRIFVAINCAAMPDTLLESELFGHEKGSFTGAISRQIGKFELSNNGTILLDEISEMSLAMQTKLLRVLQECEIYRVGGSKPIPLNLRVIATTNRDLFKFMKEGNFREDLFYRINVIPIVLPPLRERGDDVLLLAREFLQEYAILHARSPLEFTAGAKQKILSHPWHGNVRELANAMERAVLVGDFDVIEEGAVESPIARTTDFSPVATKGMRLSEIEKEVILKTLDKNQGNRTKTANQLGISLRTLRNKLKSYGVNSVGAKKA